MPAGETASFLLAVTGQGSPGGPHSSKPAEVWEVFAHGVPLLGLIAPVGRAATASRSLLVPARGDLRCFWRGCGSRELQASIGSAAGAAVAALQHASSRGISCRLVLTFEPAGISHRELLLSVVTEAAGGWGQSEAELLLVSLDSSGTAVSRTFEVAVPAGQAVSKKVRYSNPYSEARRFTVRLPGSSSGSVAASRPLLRIPRPSFELAAGEEASIKLTFDAAAAAHGFGSAPAAGRQQRQELLAVVESSPAGEVGPEGGGSSGAGNRGSSSGRVGGGVGAAQGGGSSCRVEEVFRVILTVT